MSVIKSKHGSLIVSGERLRIDEFVTLALNHPENVYHINYLRVSHNQIVVSAVNVLDVGPVIDIRRFYKRKDQEYYYPSQRGICMSFKEWKLVLPHLQKCIDQFKSEDVLIEKSA